MAAFQYDWDSALRTPAIRIFSGILLYVPSNLANLQIGWPICQSQIAQPICKWDDQYEIFLKYCFLSVKHIQCYLTPYFYSN